MKNILDQRYEINTYLDVKIEKNNKEKKIKVEEKAEDKLKEKKSS